MKFKGFFSYKKPEVLEHGYEFLEGDEESSSWEKRDKRQSKSASSEEGESKHDSKNQDGRKNQENEKQKKKNQNAEEESKKASDHKEKEGAERSSEASGSSDQHKDKNEEGQDDEGSNGENDKALKAQCGDSDEKDDDEKSSDDNKGSDKDKKNSEKEVEPSKNTSDNKTDEDNENRSKKRKSDEDKDEDGDKEELKNQETGAQVEEDSKELKSSNGQNCSNERENKARSSGDDASKGKQADKKEDSLKDEKQGEESGSAAKRSDKKDKIKDNGEREPWLNGQGPKIVKPIMIQELKHSKRLTVLNSPESHKDDSDKNDHLVRSQGYGRPSGTETSAESQVFMQEFAKESSPEEYLIKEPQGKDSPEKEQEKQPHSGSQSAQQFSEELAQEISPQQEDAKKSGAEGRHKESDTRNEKESKRSPQKDESHKMTKESNPKKDEPKGEEASRQESSANSNPKSREAGEKCRSDESKPKAPENPPKLKSVSPSLKDNIDYLKAAFHSPKNSDIILREFNIAQKVPACMVFIDGMIDKNIVIQFSMPELMYANPEDLSKDGYIIDFIEKNLLTINQVARMCKYEDIITQILAGLTIILVEGCEEVLVLESRGFEKRSVASPVTETVVHGSQEGFTENLRTNITLVRRIVKNENLITEFHDISKTNNALCALMYMEGFTNKRIVDEVRKRITNLDVDYIAGNGMLEQLIEDKPSMLFPQIISTERPDRVASFLLDGKVVVICEGTPFALAMPITFFDLFQTSEDANVRWQYGSFLRIIRLIGVLMAALLPGLYVAITLFQQEMIPTSLLASIVVARRSVPFPTIVEIILMEISFELIREGGIRVPGVTGQTLGIIGALILGQAAVSAGLVSPVLIIIVAITGLGSFAIPNYSLSLAVRIVRFVFIALGGLAGFYGISVGLTIVGALALGMKSFGVPFFTPVTPVTRVNKDKIVRGPLYTQSKRPDYLNTQNEVRMGEEPRGWIKSKTKGGSSK
ncbi:MAG: spore germination protein [Clostridia bacterium]|nr:spore germination protein [Clostridia bacterium]